MLFRDQLVAQTLICMRMCPQYAALDVRCQFTAHRIIPVNYETLLLHLGKFTRLKQVRFDEGEEPRPENSLVINFLALYSLHIAARLLLIGQRLLLDHLLQPVTLLLLNNIGHLSIGGTAVILKTVFKQILQFFVFLQQKTARALPLLARQLCSPIL